MVDRFFSRLRLEAILASATVALGLYHAWLGRYAMDPDGMSYLDVGQSFFRRDWANAINAWWSPLYPWAEGLVIGFVNPSPKWEFPVARLVSFSVFVLALLAFRFLLHGFFAFQRERIPNVGGNEGQALPEWTLVLVGYSIFLWTALEIETPWDVTPDLAVMACICLTAGMILRLRPKDGLWKFAIFGLILGVSYWTKAILFPLGFLTLAATYWWKRSIPGWNRRILVATLSFLCSSGVLIFLLSQQKGRFTFGDTGRTAYAFYVSPRIFWRNWHGDIPDSGVPAHPTRRLLQHPPLYEFDGPVVGTYPPWTDPSYWNEGVTWHFKLKPQIEVFAGTVPSEIRLLTRTRPDLLVSVLVLAFLCGRMWLASLRRMWPLLAISIAGMGLYLPLTVGDRYLGGFILVLYVAAFAAVRLPEDAQRVGAIICLVVFFTMALATADYTVRLATHHFAIPGNGPNSTDQDRTAAEDLWRMGIQPGDKVAIIMDGTGAYWAHMAKVRIVAEIMDSGGGSKEFWSAPVELQRHVYDLFASTHAKLVLSYCSSSTTLSSDWEPMAGTPYCFHRLN